MSYYHDLERVGSDLKQGANVFMRKQLATTRIAVPRFHASLVRRTTMLSLRSGPYGAVSLYVWMGWQPHAQEGIFWMRGANATDHQRGRSRRRIWARARTHVLARARARAWARTRAWARARA